MPIQKIDIPSPRESFIEQLERQIIKGDLVVGEKLPTEREFEEQTGINQSVIHYALKDLERMGFVKIIPRRGVFVEDFAKKGTFETLNELLRHNDGKVSVKMGIELVELRNAIEGGALIRLAANHTADDIAKLRACVDELRSDKVGEMNIKELAALTMKFHYLVIELSGNDMFLLTMNAFVKISRIIWIKCAEFWGADGFLEQDEKLIDMIEEGRGHDAQKYIEDIFARFLDEFEPFAPL